jgi:hypothetical protein
MRRIRLALLPFHGTWSIYRAMHKSLCTDLVWC